MKFLIKRYKGKLTLLERVEADLAKGEHAMAVRRLEGSLEYNPLNEVVLDKIAAIFYAYGLEERAGRYWYLFPIKKENQVQAAKLFEVSLGNDPTLILKKLITKTRFSFSKLTDGQLLILEELLMRVKQKESITPRFLQSLETHILKRKQKRI